MAEKQVSQALQALEMAGDGLNRPSADAADDLNRFRDLLLKWQSVQNLVSAGTLDAFWTRHVADSLQLLKYMPKGNDLVVDLGSGGGFPAIPLAIALKSTDVRFVLVEANKRKVAFLREVARGLDLAVKVEPQRIEMLVSRETIKADVITSRALARMDQLCTWAYPFWQAQTRALFHKGREYVDECTESGARWDYDMVVHPSVTDRSGVIIELTNLRPKTG